MKTLKFQYVAEQSCITSCNVDLKWTNYQIGKRPNAYHRAVTIAKIDKSGVSSSCGQLHRIKPTCIKPRGWLICHMTRPRCRVSGDDYVPFKRYQ